MSNLKHKKKQKHKKIINNAVSGKTMESLRSRIDVRLVSNEYDYLKWTSKPNPIKYLTMIH